MMDDDAMVWILFGIANEFGVLASDLLGRSHPYRLYRARTVTWLALYEAGATQVQIGAMFGRKQHTISYGLVRAMARKGA